MHETIDTNIIFLQITDALLCILDDICKVNVTLYKTFFVHK